MLALQAEVVVVDPLSDPLGLRRARRPAERRQVDARQRDGRPQGRDRVRQAADDAARDPRRGDARRRPDRAHRPAGRAAPARRADAADAAPRRAGAAARPTPRCSSSTRDQGVGGAGRPLDRRGAAARAGVPVVIAVNKVDRTSNPRTVAALQAAADLGLDAEVFPVSARTGQRASRRSSTTSPRCCPRARSTSRPRRSPTSPSRSCSPSSCASRCSPARARRSRTRSRSRSRRSRTAATCITVRALLWVETESQKGIVIGSGGRMIKAIGTAARRELERELGSARPPRPLGARAPLLARRRRAARPARDHVARRRCRPATRGVEVAHVAARAGADPRGRRRPAARAAAARSGAAPCCWSRATGASTVIRASRRKRSCDAAVARAASRPPASARRPTPRRARRRAAATSPRPGSRPPRSRRAPARPAAGGST